MRADVPTIAPGERIEAAPTFRSFRMGLMILGVWSLITLIGVSLLAVTARAQSYPTQTYSTTPAYSAPNTYRPSQRHIVRGAGRGAALGAVGGAIAGDAGKGAAAGAAMGSMVGGFRRLLRVSLC
jgi:Glycine-zipper domain